MEHSAIAPRISAPITRVVNMRAWGGDAVDIDIDDGRIVTVSPHDAARPVTTTMVDAHGSLALPGFVNAHAHVDKSWWGLNWQPYGGEGGTDGRIRWERERRADLGIPGARATRAVLAELVRHGTTAIRSHVDVDLGIGLDGIRIVRDALAEYDGTLAAELVAFPQDGVLRRPGVDRLLEQAAATGVEHIGGLDPAGIDRDPVGQLDVLFGIASHHGCGVDIHLHDAAELGAFELELIIAGTERAGAHGRVNVAHGFALTQVDAARRHDLLQAMGALDISVTTVAPPRMPPLSLEESDRFGVPVGLGTDGIRDLWSPYGTGDLLGIAWQLARAGGAVTDEAITRVVRAATSSAARFVGRDVHDLVVGAPADIVLLDAENVADALVRTPRRELVIAAGRVIHDARHG